MHWAKAWDMCYGHRIPGCLWLNHSAMHLSTLCKTVGRVNPRQAVVRIMVQVRIFYCRAESSLNRGKLCSRTNFNKGACVKVSINTCVGR